jgi:ABC-type glycerol-3-phosphate transport system substrate-binding protein
VVAALAATSLAACGGDEKTPADGDKSGSPAAGDQKVTISVSDYPSTENADARAAFERQAEAFQELYPNITIEPTETAYQADTIQALIAGGTMPTTLLIPFTDIGRMMELDQVADLTDYAANSEALSNLNPSVAKIATDSSGRIRGVPYSAYTMALLYNRSLFTEAGLDPDAPPTTWEEVRAAAKTLTEKTDAQGFELMTMENTGGWMLTNMSYAFGGKPINDEGTESTVNNPGTKAALEFYRAIRWDDNAMGDNFLVNWGDQANDFASGKTAMTVFGADAYNRFITNLGMSKDDYGVAPLPQGTGGLGALGGGGVLVVNPASTPEQIDAAVKWAEFYWLAPYIDQERAVQRAKDDLAAGTPVGAPGLPIVNAAQYEKYLGWIAEYIDVPRENYTLYTSTVETLPIVPEPSVAGQEIYAALDPVVQEVLTNRDADIDKLLADAQVAVQAILDAAQ